VAGDSEVEQAPLADSDFEGADGGFAVRVEGGLPGAGGGEKVDLAGETVTVGVEPGSLRAASVLGAVGLGFGNSTSCRANTGPTF
jgi:hypothetical protein